MDNYAGLRVKPNQMVSLPFVGPTDKHILRLLSSTNYTQTLVVKLKPVG